MGQACSSASIPSSDGPAPVQTLRRPSEVRKASRHFLETTTRKSMDSTVWSFADQFEVDADATRPMRQLSVLSEDSVNESDMTDVSSVIGRAFNQEKVLWASRLKWTPTFQSDESWISLSPEGRQD